MFKTTSRIIHNHSTMNTLCSQNFHNVLKSCLENILFYMIEYRWYRQIASWLGFVPLMKPYHMWCHVSIGCGAVKAAKWFWLSHVFVWLLLRVLHQPIQKFLWFQTICSYTRRHWAVWKLSTCSFILSRTQREYFEYSMAYAVMAVIWKLISFNFYNLRESVCGFQMCVVENASHCCQQKE